MEIDASTKFMVIVIITVTLPISFKLQKLATINSFGFHRPHVDNTDTLYLGDQHCLVKNNVCF